MRRRERGFVQCADARCGSSSVRTALSECLREPQLGRHVHNRVGLVYEWGHAMSFDS